MGNNTPLADLMVVSPEDHIQFLIDVKGLARPNYWQVSRKEKRDDLFYVFAFVPKGEPNKFFVLPQKKVNACIDAEFARLKPEKRALGERANRLGLRWGDTKLFADKWDVLPA